MDESSLRAQLARLEVSRTSLHSSFRRWEWIVVAGIVLELVVLVKEYWDGWRAYHRATIRLPEKPNTLLFGLGVLGVAMVAGGISKELGIDSQIEGVETQIRGVNEQLFGIVSKEAEAAFTKSQLAQDKSGEADASSTYALGLAKETIEIEEARAWRRLTKKQIADIGKILEPLSPPFSPQQVQIGYVRGDSESNAFARDINSALKAAKWNVQPFPTPFVLSASLDPLVTGVTIKSGRTFGSIGDALSAELMKRGFDSRSSVCPPGLNNRMSALEGCREDMIIVQVELRPEGPQGAAKLKQEKQTKKQNK